MLDPSAHSSAAPVFVLSLSCSNRPLADSSFSGTAAQTGGGTEPAALRVGLSAVTSEDCQTFSVLYKQEFN